MYLKILTAFVALSLLFNSCSLFDNESYKPIYLILKDPVLTTRAFEGDPVHEIKDVWVYANGNFIGIFPLPAKVPVIPTGESIDILISPGVQENGDINSSSEYPFMERIETSITASAGEEVVIPLKFQYKSDIKFDIVEGFESSFQIFSSDVDGDFETTVNLATEDKVSGARSGRVTLNNSHKDFIVSTPNYFDNADNAKGSVFLEFDYKCDENLFVGSDLVTSSAQISDYKVVLVKSDEWRRAYINFTEEISNLSVLGYRVVFGASYEKNTGVDSKLYLDNIKLIHF